MEIFQKLGATVEKIWREKNYSEDLFPEIAERAIKEFDLPSKVSAWNIVNWVFREDYLPEQRDLSGRFGDPPITLYNSPRFHIDIYFWLDGTTSIHQHAFCGAFQVILGSSLHSRYEFERQEAVNQFTEIGALNLEDCELLQVGDVRPILAGRSFIHALFHLDQPSATIVIRTHRSPLHLPQFDYLKPFLAIDPFYEDPTTAKKLQTVSMLMRTKRPGTDRIIAEWLKQADFQTTFTILSHLKSLLQNNRLEQLFDTQSAKDRWETLSGIARQRHGALTDILPEVFKNQQQISEIVNRRGYITNAEHRFFLALLLNVEGKDRIFSLVRQRFPEHEPLEKILDWVSELSRTKVFGSNLPNALGMENFSDFDLFILEDLLNDLPVEEIQINQQRHGQNQDVDQSSENLNERIKIIRESIILKPLFS
jgi:hypothetical protein